MKKWLITILLISLLVVGGLAAFGYLKLWSPATQAETDFYIPTGSTMEDFRSSLLDSEVITDADAFDLGVKVLQMEKDPKPGKYHIEKGWTILKLLRKFRAGDALPVKVTFHNVRTLEAVAGKACINIEADSAEILKALRNEDVWKENAVYDATFCNIIPNTYEFFWNTSGSAFAERMAKEADKFWNEYRLKKAQEMGLSPCEVVNLAAIVQEEQSAILDEQPRIAGLYYNRLKRRMLLQADPTLKYAAGDFTIKRLLNYHKTLESPYNTYKYAGLPPTPIVIPEISAIDAVLDYEAHSYLYMCAKEDFSGYHNFAKTLVQHNINAIRYQRALSREMRKNK